MTGPAVEWSSFFHVLSDAHRITILQILAGGSELSVSDIGEHLNQTQPAVSHHLSLLKEAGLINYRRDGRFNRYAIVKDGLAKAIERLTGQSVPMAVPFAGLEIRFNHEM